MEHHRLDANATVTILDILGVDLCARAILNYVPVRELVRSERVCKRWQQVMHYYLRGYRRSDILDDAYHFNLKLFRKGYNNTYRTYGKTETYCSHKSLLATCKILEKFGFPEAELSDERLKNTVSECPFLRHLQGQNIKFFFQDCKELSMTEILKDIRPCICDTLTDRQRQNEIVRGNLFLPGAHRYIRNPFLPNRFQGNSARNYRLPIRDRLQGDPKGNCYRKPTGTILYPTLKALGSILSSVIFNLRNVTTLELDDQDMTYLDYAHLLLNEMPQLENLSLCNYTWSLCNAPYMVSNEQLIESISRLANLNRLVMRNNEIVSDVLLEALARRCRKLKYVDISDDSAHGHSKRIYSKRGVVALCRKLPSDSITLCLGYIQDFTIRGLTSWLQTIPVVQELQSLGCVELTPQWLAEVCHASRAQRHPLELRVGDSNWSSPGQSAQIDASHNDIKIVLSTDVHTVEQYAGKTIFTVKSFQ